jgi:hypothetical protein
LTLSSEGIQLVSFPATAEDCPKSEKARRAVRIALNFIAGSPYVKA